MTLKGSGETKHRGRRRDGTNHFTAVWCVAISPIYAFLLFHPPPIVLPDIFKNLPSLLSLLSLLLFQRSPRHVPSMNAREIRTRERWKSTESRGGEGKSWTFVSRGGALFNKTGQRNIDDSIWRARGRSAVGLGFFARVSPRKPRFNRESNRIESKRTTQALSMNELAHI